MDAVEVKDLRREYRIRRGLLWWKQVQRFEALKGVSFSVKRGELFGILGPNGAGKTTTIKILSTLLLPSSGVARVLGCDVSKQAAELRTRIGFIFGGDRGLYGRITAYENLKYFTNLYHMPPQIARARIWALLEQVGLVDWAHKRVETFSRGMKQRLHIARALLHDPDLIFMDEPTIGIDPVGARELRETILGLRDMGKTILLTTHYMFEAEQLCDRIAILTNGQVAALETPERLRAEAADMYVLEVTVYRHDPETFDRLQRLNGVRRHHVAERNGAQVISLQCSRGQEMVSQVDEALGETPHGGIVVREPTLEDAYVKIVSSGHGEEEKG